MSEKNTTKQGDPANTNAADRPQHPANNQEVPRPGGQRIPGQPTQRQHPTPPPGQPVPPSLDEQHPPIPTEVTEHTRTYDPSEAASVYYRDKGRRELASQLGLSEDDPALAQLGEAAPILADEFNRRILGAFLIGGAVVGLLVYVASRKATTATSDGQ